MASTAEQVVMARIEALEAFVTANKVPGPQGIGERNLAKTMLDMEIFVSTLISDPLCNKATSSQSLKTR